MKAIAFFLTVIVTIGSYNSKGQGFIPPAKGNSVVYFVRVGAYNVSVPFTYFDGKELIADFASRLYFRYECKPGAHLFWASGDNKQFLPSDLKAGETYIIYVEAKQGSTALPNVALTPINVKHKDFHKAKHMIFHQESLKEDPQKLKEENERMRNFIEKSVDEFQTANPKPDPLLTTSLAIPIEKIK